MDDHGDLLPTPASRRAQSVPRSTACCSARRREYEPKARGAHVGGSRTRRRHGVARADQRAALDAMITSRSLHRAGFSLVGAFSSIEEPILGRREDGMTVRHTRARSSTLTPVRRGTRGGGQGRVDMPQLDGPTPVGSAISCTTSRCPNCDRVSSCGCGKAEPLGGVDTLEEPQSDPAAATGDAGLRGTATRLLRGPTRSP